MTLERTDLLEGGTCYSGLHLGGGGIAVREKDGDRPLFGCAVAVERSQRAL